MWDPVHLMLIVFPMGLLATSVIFDILYSIVRRPVFVITAFYMSVSGTLGGLLAAVFGLMDWMVLPSNSRARRLGAWHGLGNFVIVNLFAISSFLRRRNTNFVPNSTSRVLSLTGLGFALITSWIGGELVYRLGVGVDPGANVNAPNSLTHSTASIKQGKK